MGETGILGWQCLMKTKFQIEVGARSKTKRIIQRYVVRLSFKGIVRISGIDALSSRRETNTAVE